MVVDEGKLLKLMAKAYKTGGYHVAVGNEPYPCYMIAPYGYSWAVLIHKMHMPWAVLGEIVKHIGSIPEADEAYLAQKDEVQDEVWDVAAKPLLNIIGKSRSGSQPALRNTGLVFAERNIWQKADDNQVVLLDPEYEELAVLKTSQAQMVDPCLYARGDHSMVFIGKIAPGPHERERIDHLGKIRWA